MTATAHLFEASPPRPGVGDEAGAGRASAASGRRPHVVIVGAGFGGLTTAQRLARAPVDLTVIDRRNHHLFQPLLYQVATAGLSPADIAMPVRRVLSGQANAAVVLGEVEGVDLDGRAVTVDGRRIGYDFLVLATGAGTPILATTSGSLSRPA